MCDHPAHIEAFVRRVTSWNYHGRREGKSNIVSIARKMLTLPFTLLAILLGVAHVSGAPALASSSLSTSPTRTSSVVSSTQSTVTDTAPSSSAIPTDGEYASTEPNFPLWGQDDQNANPQPIRGAKGVPILAQDNKQIDIQNPDLLAPPSTDHGNVPNAKWPFSLSHNRLLDGGWVRQQNVNAMPIATAMAGVNMRLEAGAIRELHWHRTSEWAYVLKGYTQITAVDAKGRNFISTVGPGDLWYFPPGVPHSLQATNQTEGGSEFLLVFPDGQFSADDTFQLTEWLAHVPSEVIAKNFQVDAKEFNRIPAEQLFIFPGTSPNPNGKAPESPQGAVPDPYSFEFSKVKATQASGGSVRIADASTFKISKQIAVAEVTVEPGALRELHWHPTEDEWSFFLEGTARVTIFASQGNSNTFDYRAGDIGYVPFSMGHYVENTGNTTLKFLEIFNTDTFEDVSLNQWLALTPPEMVKAHLQLSDSTINKLSKTKPVVIGPGTD